jgi:hypothetical protein
MKDYSKQILTDGIKFTLNGSGTNNGITNGQYKLLTGHGPVVKIGVLLGSDMVEDLADLDITINYNNSNVINKNCGLLFRQNQYGTQKEFRTLQWQEGSIINIIVNNTGANSMVLALIFYYAPADLADLNAAIVEAQSSLAMITDYIPAVS